MSMLYASDPPNIAARRMEEDRLRAMRDTVSAAAKVGQMADFEHRTQAKINSRVARDRVERGKALMADNLALRRAKLARMLEDERRMYEKEIEASFETPEQTKEKMFARARALQAQREAARQEQLKVLEEKRWRQQSDLLRARDSQLTVLKTTEDRAAQLAEKQEIARREKEEADRFAAQWKADAEARAERERAEAAVRAEANAALRSELDRLTSMRSGMRDAEKEYERDTDKATMDHWRKLEEEEAARVAAKKAREAEEHARVMEMNRIHSEKRAIEAAKEFEEDKARLAATLDKEAAEDKAEREYAAALKAEAQAHRRALVEQMAIQAEETGYLDEMQREFEEAMWKKRQDQWDAEAEARRRLMQEVDETRKMQLREMDVRAKAERDAAEVEAAELRAKVAAEEAAELERAAAAKASLREQQEHVVYQMEQRKRADRLAKQQEFLEVKLMAREEQKYQKKVDELLASGAASSDYRRKKSQWFY